MDRSTKFNILDRLESGTELCSAHEYGIAILEKLQSLRQRSASKTE